MEVQYRTDEHGSFRKSTVIATDHVGLGNVADAVSVLSNDGGADLDYNDTYLTLTMFKQSAD